MRRSPARVPWAPPAPVPRRRRALAGRTRRFAQALLHEQCWCWGRDIARPEGNLLLAHGFERIRPPAGVVGSTHYRLQDGARSVGLWGFGLFYAEAGRGGVFLGRDRFQPRLADEAVPDEAWSPGRLRALRYPRGAEAWRLARSLAAGACRWMAEYEGWVLRHAGLDWRRAVVAAWDHPAAPAELLACSWLDVAREVGREG